MSFSKFRMVIYLIVAHVKKNPKRTKQRQKQTKRYLALKLKLNETNKPKRTNKPKDNKIDTLTSNPSAYQVLQ